MRKLVIVTGLLAVFFLLFGIRIVRQLCEEKLQYQSVVSLEGLEWEGDLEEELEKIRGISSFTLALEVPIRLKAEEYTMDITVIGVELDRLEKQISRSQETPLGNTPVLLLGEESLSEMTDRNGHKASEEKQKELLERSGEILWQYCLIGEETLESWNPCLIAGTMYTPAGEIYMPFGQAKALVGTEETSKFLLSVRGKENYERALEYFQGSLF
ncbi:MAG: hypothetical protein HFI63_02835 [Lachnospiraceae bacterium]|nr:hypothetical protein [Lachnospiraceae bacterium]